MLRSLLGLTFVLSFGLLAGTVGCGDSGGDGGGGIDCATETVKGYSELTGAFQKCTNCHASTLTSPTDRQSATMGYDYDTYELAKKFPARIAARVEKGDMPPTGSPELTAQEADDLLVWSSCGTPP